MPGLLDSLDGELAREGIRRQETGAQPSKLKAGKHRFAVTTQWGARRQRGERAKAENRRRESETRRLTYHPPNLGMELRSGYIPIHGRAGPEPPKSDTLGRR